MSNIVDGQTFVIKKSYNDSGLKRVYNEINMHKNMDFIIGFDRIEGKLKIRNVHDSDV